MNNVKGERKGKGERERKGIREKAGKIGIDRYGETNRVSKVE